DPLALANGGDGLGPVYNAASCAACHHQGGLGGSGGLQHNVTTFIVRPICSTDKPREGVVHAYAYNGKYQETLQQVNSALPAISRPTLAMLVNLPGSKTELIAFPRGV